MTVNGKRGGGRGDADRSRNTGQESGERLSDASPKGTGQRGESPTAKWRHADDHQQALPSSASQKDREPPSAGIDSALIAAAKAGDAAAMNLLLLRLEERLDRVVRSRRTLLASILADEHDAKQEARTKLWRKLGSFRGDESSLRSWVVRVAARAITDLVRRERRLVPRTSSGPRPRVDFRTPSTEGDPAVVLNPRRDGAGAASWEERQLVRAALLALNERDGRALDLCVCQDVPYSEVAARLGLPTADAARMLCARALNRLRRQLLALRAPRKGGCRG